MVGDTLIAPPEMSYEQKSTLVLQTTNSPYIPMDGKYGKIKIELPQDSGYTYVVLRRLDGEGDTTVLRSSFRTYGNILPPGTYELVFVTGNSSFLVYDNILVKANETYCVRNAQPVFTRSNDLIRKLASDYITQLINKERESQLLRDSLILTQGMPLVPGTAKIRGKVVDGKGDPVASASVFLKGYKEAAVTNANGEFAFDNMHPGTYTLVVSYVGYETKEVMANAGPFSLLTTIKIVARKEKLGEVVVVGYSTVRKKTLKSGLNFSMKSKPLWWLNSIDYDYDGVVTKMDTTINGDWYVNGMTMASPSFGNNISIRGQSSINGDFGPLYVVDGVLVDALPDGLDANTSQITILKDAAATSIYGARAGNGVVVITTKGFTGGKEIRDRFQDYAFWQPNLFTDKNGVAKFTVTYPDNITSWQTYVIGMDKKKRYTTGRSQIKSFKPLIAQVATPQFLIEGDSTALIGKTINYSTTDNSVRNEFTLNGEKKGTADKLVKGNSSSTEELVITTSTADTLTVQYSLVSTAGFKDGELKRIPVFKKGIEETIGSFWMLEKDTAVSFMPDKNAGTITIHAQNNTLDVLLDELKYLKKYPYYCMEQMASKLTGLVMEKKIREMMRQPFRNERELSSLVSRLQKAQLFEGGWSWWPGGKANLIVTNYVTRALLMVSDHSLVETNIRDALLYLQGQLKEANRYELLPLLYTLSEAEHHMDYAFYLGGYSFDSLSVHDQWQYIRIKQNAKLDYAKELNEVMQKQIGTMLGGLHWGEDNYWWDRNVVATTVLAYKTLEKEKDKQAELKRIIQFFLERRKRGHWTNTVESASIVSAILPAILDNQSTFAAPASIRINNSITANQFPFTTTVTPTDAAITINKTGGGLLYCTAYQEVFNKNPLPVTDKFKITISFERSGSNIAILKAGEKVLMKINVEAMADADYVQIEIPIPAGCTYGTKKQNHWDTHTEYLKNKAVFFIEKLSKGTHQYEVELEPRYTGTYTLNPAKAELMYFPVFFGRNETKSIPVKK